MSELLPCPFCGCKGELVGAVGTLDAACSNANCSMFRPRMTAKEWNTRAPGHAPIEPTEAMIEAGVNCLVVECGVTRFQRSDVADVYRAMLKESDSE